jgi:glycosyltransferase involved in cell wall biosynthesis
MTTISACIITLNDADFIQLCLRSVLPVVDEVIVVDGGSTDGTLEKIDELNDSKIKVIHNKWSGNYGNQRNIALKYATGVWIYQIDSDEVLCDKGYLLREVAEKNTPISTMGVGEHGVFDIRMEHFIRDFGHVDNTVPEHWCMNRLAFNNGNLNYSRGMHEIIEGCNIKNKGKLPKELVVYHLGYLKGIGSIVKKYKKNLKDSPIHSRDFLDDWKDKHLTGRYPVRDFDLKELDSDIIREEFCL